MNNHTIEQIWNDVCRLLFPTIGKREIGSVISFFIMLRMSDDALSKVHERIQDCYTRNKDKISDSELERLLYQTAGFNFYNISDYTLSSFSDSFVKPELFVKYLEGYDAKMKSYFRKAIRYSVIDRLIKNNLLAPLITLFNNEEVHLQVKLLREVESYQNEQNERKSIVRESSDDGHFLFILYDDKLKENVELNRYLCVWDFKEGFARFITKQGRWGFLSEDTNEEMILSPSYYHVEDFSCGRAKVQIKNERCGYIDYRGELVIPAEFRDVTNFDFDCAFVNDAWNRTPFGIDINGNILPEYKETYLKEKGELETVLKDYMEENDKQVEKESFERNLRECPADDEANIMGALAGGNGDVYGF